MFRVLTVPNAFVPIIAPIAASVISKPGKFFYKAPVFVKKGLKDLTVQSNLVLLVLITVPAMESVTLLLASVLATRISQAWTAPFVSFSAQIIVPATECVTS